VSLGDAGRTSLCHPLTGGWRKGSTVIGRLPLVELVLDPRTRHRAHAQAAEVHGYGTFPGFGGRIRPLRVLFLILDILLFNVLLLLLLTLISLGLFLLMRLLLCLVLLRMGSV
jgi:hypothetical protein